MKIPIIRSKQAIFFCLLFLLYVKGVIRMSYEAMLDEMRAYLKRNRISQSELARRLFVSSSAVSQWLTGRKNCSM